MSASAPLRLLAISGSLRAKSVNTAVLQAGQALAPAGVAVTLYRDLGNLPHFNPDLDAAPVTLSLTSNALDAPALLQHPAVRAQLEAALAVLTQARWSSIKLPRISSRRICVPPSAPCLLNSDP